MFAERQLRVWWERRSEDQRARLKKAAEKRKLDSDTVDLLVSTQCPVGPVGTKWEADPDWTWSWPENVRTFITQQVDRREVLTALTRHISVNSAELYDRFK